jgi:hypothetical protein
VIRRAFVRSLSGAILCSLLGVKPWRLEEEDKTGGLMFLANDGLRRLPIGEPGRAVYYLEPGTVVVWIDASDPVPVNAVAVVRRWSEGYP